MTAADLSWSPAPARLELSRERVHLFSVRTDPPAAAVDALRALLDDDERHRAARYFREVDRQRFIVARAALRDILGRCLAADPRGIGFAYGPRGKPELDATCGAGVVEFNLSHSAARALVAVACERALGVDIEQLSRTIVVEDLAPRFFSARENAALVALPEPARRRAFFAIWTRKEAFIKAHGTGLAYGLDRFAVSLEAGDARLLEVADDPREAERWSLVDLDVAADYAAALAVEGSAPELVYWRWNAPVC